MLVNPLAAAPRAPLRTPSDVDVSVFPLAALPDRLLQDVVERLLSFRGAPTSPEQGGLWDLSPPDPLHGLPPPVPELPLYPFGQSMPGREAEYVLQEARAVRAALRALVGALGPGQGLRVVAAALGAGLVPGESAAMLANVSRPNILLGRALGIEPATPTISDLYPRYPPWSLVPVLRWFEGPKRVVRWREKVRAAAQSIQRDDLYTGLLVAYVRDRDHNFVYEMGQATQSGRLDFSGCVPGAPALVSAAVSSTPDAIAIAVIDHLQAQRAAGHAREEALKGTMVDRPLPFRAAPTPAELQFLRCTLSGARLEALQMVLFQRELAVRRFEGSMLALSSLRLLGLRELHLTSLASNYHAATPTALALPGLTALTTILPGIGAPALHVGELRALRRLVLTPSEPIALKLPPVAAARQGWTLGAQLLPPPCDPSDSHKRKEPEGGDETAGVDTHRPKKKWKGKKKNKKASHGQKEKTQGAGGAVGEPSTGGPGPGLPSDSPVALSQPPSFLSPTLLGLQRLAALEHLSVTYLGQGSIAGPSDSPTHVLGAFIKPLAAGRLASLTELRLSFGPGFQLNKQLAAMTWQSAAYCALLNRLPALQVLALDPAPPPQAALFLPSTLTSLALLRTGAGWAKALGLWGGARLGASLRELTMSAAKSTATDGVVIVPKSLPDSAFGHGIGRGTGAGADLGSGGGGPGASDRMGTDRDRSRDSDLSDADLSDTAQGALRGPRQRLRSVPFKELELTSLTALRRLELDLRADVARGWTKSLEGLCLPPHLRELRLVASPGKDGHRPAASSSLGACLRGPFPRSLRTVVLRIEEGGPESFMAFNSVSRTAPGPARFAKMSLLPVQGCCVDSFCDRCAAAFSMLRGLGPDTAPGLRTLKLAVTLRWPFPDVDALAAALVPLTQLGTVDLAATCVVAGTEAKSDYTTGEHGLAWVRRPLRDAPDIVRRLRESTQKNKDGAKYKAGPGSHKTRPTFEILL